MANNNDAKEFTFLEPYGHTSPKSKFERYWDRFKGPFGLYRRRVPQYSVYAGMTHFPMQYTMRQFKLDAEVPDTAWIVKNFKAFVRTEFSERVQTEIGFPDPWPIKIDQEIKLPERFLKQFLIKSEWTERIEIELPNENSPEEIANCLYGLLCNPKIGSSKNADFNDRQEFIDWVVPTIRDKSRLLFVIPGFPFKDQNRFRVPFDGSIPDLGEIAFIIRLFNLTQTMFQVHPHGVDIVILTDGELYREIFGVPKEMVSDYMRRLLSYRRILNVQGAISFICLKELIDRASEDSVAWTIADRIRENIENLLRSSDAEVSAAFDVLVAGMKWNVNSRSNLIDLSDGECWKVLRSREDDIEVELKEQWRRVNDTAVKAALRYASINLMLRWTKLVSRFFPEAIRGTVHPKPRQFALAGAGLSFPWNGVAASKKWPANIDDVRIMPFMSLSEFPRIKMVKLEETDLPLFYTASAPNENIEAAKNVLKGDGWYLDNMFGREFKQSDITEFINLGLDDENYSWERKRQTEQYFTGLFQFRISHYSKYGFGIHGVWLNEKLIGQFGLQVYSEDQDELEVVLFLGKAYTGKGLGSRLFNYIVERCKILNISCLYGIVRPDNLAGIHLLKRFKCQRYRTVKHFNQEGILYRITVKGG